MSNFAAFQGTFSDFRTVKGRKVVQLIIEVPHELGNVALQALGGIPDPANPIWVAVARLDAKQAVAEQPKQLPAPEKPKRNWDDISMPSQAALRVRSEAFRRFLAERYTRSPGLPLDEEQADALVKAQIGVDSKAELRPGSHAGMAWAMMDAEFQEWMREPTFG